MSASATLIGQGIVLELLRREHNTLTELTLFPPDLAQQHHDTISSYAAFVPSFYEPQPRRVYLLLYYTISLLHVPPNPSFRHRPTVEAHKHQPQICRGYPLPAQRKVTNPTRPASHPRVCPRHIATLPVAPGVTMSVAYEPRSFHGDSPYAPVGENDHDMNKFINEANVADMANLAAATYEPANESPSPVFDTSPSPALDLHPVGPPNVDPANVPVRELSPAAPNVFNSTHTQSHRIKPIAKPNREVTKSEDGKFICTWSECNELVKKFQRKCEWR